MWYICLSPALTLRLASALSYFHLCLQLRYSLTSYLCISVRLFVNASLSLPSSPDFTLHLLPHLHPKYKGLETCNLQEGEMALLSHTHMDWRHRLFSGLDNDQWLSKCCEWAQKTQSVFAVWADMLTAAIFCPDSWLTVQLGSELPLRVCAFMWSHASLFFKENKVFKRKISSLVALLNSS